MTIEELQDLPDYPEETEGSILAAQARKEANFLSDEEREEFFRSALATIYGAHSAQAVCSRH
jgi:hypothetical protein